MKHKRITISAMTVVLIATTAVTILAMHTRSRTTLEQSKYVTYFTYSQDELKQIKYAKKETLSV